MAITIEYRNPFAGIAALAAGYFKARKDNQSAENRAQYQQDLRAQAANNQLAGTVGNAISGLGVAAIGAQMDRRAPQQPAAFNPDQPDGPGVPFFRGEGMSPAIGLYQNQPAPQGPPQASPIPGAGAITAPGSAIGSLYTPTPPGLTQSQKYGLGLAATGQAISQGLAQPQSPAPQAPAPAPAPPMAPVEGPQSVAPSVAPPTPPQALPQAPPATPSIPGSVPTGPGGQPYDPAREQAKVDAAIQQRMDPGTIQQWQDWQKRYQDWRLKQSRADWLMKTGAEKLGLPGMPGRVGNEPQAISRLFEDVAGGKGTPYYDAASRMGIRDGGGGQYPMTAGPDGRMRGGGLPQTPGGDIDFVKYGYGKLAGETDMGTVPEQALQIMTAEAGYDNVTDFLRAHGKEEYKYDQIRDKARVMGEIKRAEKLKDLKYMENMGMISPQDAERIRTAVAEAGIPAALDGGQVGPEKPPAPGTASFDVLNERQMRARDMEAAKQPAFDDFQNRRIKGYDKAIEAMANQTTPISKKMSKPARQKAVQIMRQRKAAIMSIPKGKRPPPAPEGFSQPWPWVYEHTKTGQFFQLDPTSGKLERVSGPYGKPPTPEQFKSWGFTDDEGRRWQWDGNSMEPVDTKDQADPRASFITTQLTPILTSYARIQEAMIREGKEVEPIDIGGWVKVLGNAYDSISELPVGSRKRDPKLDYGEKDAISGETAYQHMREMSVGDINKHSGSAPKGSYGTIGKDLFVSDGTQWVEITNPDIKSAYWKAVTPQAEPHALSTHGDFEERG